MHVHGVFPYVFVRCNAAAEPPLSYLHEFAAGLDKAINAALGNVASTRQHVYKISLVSGMSVSVVLLCLRNCPTLHWHRIPPFPQIDIVGAMVIV